MKYVAIALLLLANAASSSAWAGLGVHDGPRACDEHLSPEAEAALNRRAFEVVQWLVYSHPALKNAVRAGVRDRLVLLTLPNGFTFVPIRRKYWKDHLHEQLASAITVTPMSPEDHSKAKTILEIYRLPFSKKLKDLLWPNRVALAAQIVRTARETLAALTDAASLRDPADKERQYPGLTLDLTIDDLPREGVRTAIQFSSVKSFSYDDLKALRRVYDSIREPAVEALVSTFLRRHLDEYLRSYARFFGKLTEDDVDFFAAQNWLDGMRMSPTALDALARQEMINPYTHIQGSSSSDVMLALPSQPPNAEAVAPSPAPPVVSTFDFEAAEAYFAAEDRFLRRDPDSLADVDPAEIWDELERASTYLTKMLVHLAARTRSTKNTAILPSMEPKLANVLEVERDVEVTREARRPGTYARTEAKRRLNLLRAYLTATAEQAKRLEGQVVVEDLAPSSVRLLKASLKSLQTLSEECDEADRALEHVLVQDLDDAGRLFDLSMRVARELRPGPRSEVVDHEEP